MLPKLKFTADLAAKVPLYSGLLQLKVSAGERRTFAGPSDKQNYTLISITV